MRASSAPAGALLEPPTQQRGADRVCVVTLVASDGSLVRVPAVVGMTREKAQSTVLAAKLLFEAAEALSKAPPGTVLAQDPRAGAEVPRATVVQTTIARVELVVPAVIGLQTAVARQRMARFKIDEAVEEGNRPAGEIVRQDPQAGERRPPGAIVRIVASDGSLVEVPAVTGQKVDVARHRLEVAGLGFATSLQDNGAEPDTVLEQTPAANTVVKRGSNVTLAVSQGLGVPNVVDMQFDAAHAALGQFSVESMAAESAAPLNRVLGQSLAPGTRVAAGTAIKLSVSDASRVTVPDVRQMTLSLARAALADAGLRARLDRGPDMDGALVTEQEPSPETVVKRSSEVALVSRWVVPWWLWPLGGALALAGAVAAYLRWGRNGTRESETKKPKPPQPIEVRASVDFRPAPPQPVGAERAGPDISVEARLLPGETQLVVEEELHA
jgi:serine/threonine-protein kinase